MTAATLDTASLGLEVALPEIDKSLRQLWAQKDAATKASLVNFVVYAEDEESLDENTALIAAVTAEHACRALLVVAEPAEAEPQVRSWITAHCQIGDGGGKSVCSEQLTFLLTGRLRDELRNVVFAHLESDLPLVFFWQGAFTDRFEPHLYRRIDRLVVDSDRWDNPPRQVRALREAWRDTGAHFVVLDLVWMRNFSFRQALAGAFDECPARECIGSFERLEIAHAPAFRSTARLLAAWILHKAGWAPDALAISFVETAGAPLSRLVLSGDGASVDIARDPGAAFIHTSILTPTCRREHVTPCLPDDTATLVSERLGRGGNTPLYFRLWKIMSRWS